VLILKGKVSNIAKKIKGFQRDPLFYLGLTAVSLLVLTSFMPKTAVSSKSETPLAKTTASPFIQSVNSQSESPELYLIQENSILGFAPPMTVTPQVLGMILGEVSAETNNDVTEYEVQSGDSLGSIAENFGVSLNTLFWANNLSSSSKLKVGQKLVILPVSGVLHYVKAGDTISALAQKYKADAQGIVEFNELASDDDIFIGDILVVPGGTMPANFSSTYVQANIPVALSYFICPVASPCRITQGLHWYNAVDFSHGKCGDSIYAAAGGVVQRVKLGWNGGAGNTIFILHPNGVVTSYGHILTALVNPGDQVYQGQAIALMGGQVTTQGLSAGISTGCHVHFAVHGAANPFTK
jgi:murein DD-endopeptidase MepM/ murein hydrolase activator NlpD